MRPNSVLAPRYVVPAALLLLLIAPAIGYTETSKAVYGAIGVKEKNVVTGSILSARVMPGEAKQLVSVTTYFTGKKDKKEGINVTLNIFRRDGEKLVQIYARDYGELNDGFVGRGELQLVDLDRDGVNEIIVTYDNHDNPLVRERLGEVIVLGDDGFRVAWSGTMEYDATRNAREVPVERRDRYIRELDIPETLRTRGVTLFLNKKVIAVAGERLVEPKIVQETFPLKPSTSRW